MAAMVSGSFDRLDGRVAVGWASNAAGAAGAAAVTLEINGRTRLEAVPCEVARPDVAERVAGPGPNGFRLEIAPEWLEIGGNRVRLLNAATGRELMGSPKTLDYREARRVVGQLNEVRHGTLITGWAAYDPPTRRVPVEILVDGECIASPQARLFRRDLQLRGIGGDGHAAFEAVAPAALLDGAPHRVALREAHTGTVIDSRENVVFARTERFHDLASFHEAMYFERLVHAPFSATVERLLALFGWQADLLCARALAWPEAERPPVTVILPTFERAAYLRRAIRSVLGQRYPALELIVVDDGSTDETGAILGLFDDPRLTVIRHEGNRGVSAARNSALAAAQGEYVFYLDSDNWWDPRYLAAMLAHYAAHPDFDCAYCGQYLHGAEDEAPVALRTGPFNAGLLINRNYIDLNCFSHRRSLYRRLGGFDEDLRRLVDYDLILRYARRTKPLALEAPLSHYLRNDAERAISNSEPLDGLREAILDKHFERRTLVFGADGPRLETLCERAPPRLPGRAPVSVIVPSYNVPEVLAECLGALFETLGGDDEILVVDNASDPATIARLATLAEADARVRVRHLADNLGFSHAVNAGLAMAAPGRDVVLLNNDAIVTPGWLDALAAVLAEEPDAHVAVPQQILPPHSHTARAHAPMADPNGEIDVSVSYHHRNLLDPRGGVPAPRADLSMGVFFCVLIRRTALDALGGLDAGRAPHYGSDWMFCEAVRALLGGRIVHTAEARVYHLLQRSTNDLVGRTGRHFQETFRLRASSGPAGSGRVP